jgi:hypothetical protein
MRRNCTSESGLFNPRVLVAFVLCSLGVVLGMFSVAATPSAKVAVRNTPAPPTSFRPGQLAAGFAPTASALPPGVPLPSGMASVPRDPLHAPFSVNQQIDSPSSGPTADSSSMPLSSAVASDWSIVNSPNESAKTYLLVGVTCLSASDCWAVGRPSGVSSITIIEHWDGSSWEVSPSPDGPGTLINILSDVACAATNDCWAVGYYVTQALQVGSLVLHWDGSSWAIDAATTQNNFLYGVTCASASDCWAVGSQRTDATKTATLIERWDGSSWTVIASPNANTTENNVLYDISCATASDCWAVGSHGIDDSTRATLTEHWDGNAWTIVASPSSVLGGENVLASVTCLSPSSCWAVGYSNNGIVYQTLIEQWNGTAWAIVLSPNPVATVDNYLASVTCTSASACWAVGYSDNGQVNESLFLVWNGTVWLQETTPGVPASDGHALAGVTCVSASDCWAVGSLATGSGSPFGLIEHWDGTSWSAVTAPKVGSRPSNFLSSVTCSSESDCWAVGFWFASNVARTLIMRWDGFSWLIVPSPNVNDVDNHYLGGVTCVSASDCWAVGSRTDNIGLSARTLILHWDGTSWSIDPSAPDTSAVQGLDLEAVSCASASECMAVGFSRGSAGDYAFAMRWDGTSWSVVPVPPSTEADPFYTPSEYLYGVTCPAPSDCWAAGAHWTGTIYRTLVDHWDGSTWTVVTSPNTAADQDNILSGMACASSVDCWAVGSSNAYSQGLIEHWDGTSWSIVPSPQAGNPLNAVTCLSASDCWAAGPYYTPNPPAQTLLVHWDGTSWTKVVSPNTSATQSNTLSGIACASPSDCWAVGRYSSGGSQTLTLHYTPSPPIPTSVVSRKTHGTAGDFDIDLPLTGNPGIECRNFQDTNSGRHQIVITFAATVTVNGSQNPKATLTAPNGGSVDTVEVSNSVVTVNLKDVGNEQTINITLLNVSDGTNSGNVVIPMGVLLGDTTADGSVNSADIGQTKSQSGHAVTTSNFREDVTVDGSINSADIGLVKSKSGTALPSLP